MMKNFIRNFNFGWILVILFSLFPIVLWIFSPSFLPRFSNLSVSMSNVGQIFGLVGAAMFAINLMLSTRLKFIEKIFFGLNNVYSRHSHLGQIAFLLLIFHPLMLIPKYAGGSFLGAAKFLLPINGLAINLGWFALVGMILLIVFTIFVSIKYNIWKITHKFFGLFFFLASLHIWFIPSDVSHYLPLRIYMLLLSFIGILSYFYYTLLGKFFVKKFDYLIDSVKFLNDSVIEIIMKPMYEKIQFKAGQFVFVSFNSAEVGKESHPFSFASNSKEENISIIVKKLGDYTKKLDLLSIGTKVKIEGPYGVFSHTAGENKKQIWIAGGIGVTPFISMAKSLSFNDIYNIDLYYCLKDENEAVYLDELKNISLYLENKLKIIPFYSSLHGRISADVLEKNSLGLSDKDIFICAPPKMIDSLKLQLLSKGVNIKNIHSEEFNF